MASMKLGPIGFRTVGQKLRILIVAVPILVLVVTLVVTYCNSVWALHGEELRKYRTELTAGATALDAFFSRIALLPQCIAARQRALSRTPDDQTWDVLHEMLHSPASKDCYGLYIAFEGIDPTVQPEGMQWVDRNSKKQTRMSYNHNIRSPLSEWYHGAIARWKREIELETPPAERGHFVSEPAFEPDSSNKLLVSVTTVVEDSKGEIIGVAGVDLYCGTLDAYIRRIVKDLNAGKSAKNRDDKIVAYLLSPTHMVIARTDLETRDERPRAFVEEDGCKEGLKPQSLEGQSIVSGGVRRRLFWTQAKESGWKIVLSVPEADIDASALQMVAKSTLFGSIGPAIMVIIASIVAGWLTDPIPKLTAAAEAVESGDYRDDGLNSIATRKDEFGQLARGFQRMVAEVSTREGQLKQAQADILSRERHYRSLIENGSDVISILDRDGVIVYESPSIRRVLGYEPEELVGTPRFSFIHPDDLTRVSEAFDRKVQGLEVQAIEYRFRHRDGSWRTLEATSTNLVDDPAVEGVVINSRDVTERKRAQAEIDDLRRRYAAELEERVRIRTAELAHKNEELKSAYEATDQAMKLQEVFLSNVAHDLRTPLTIVIGYSEDMLRRARKKGQEAFIPDLSLIVNKGKDLLELINDLLNLSKAMNEKGVELDLKRFEVAPMIRSRMEGIGAISQKLRNTIELNLAPDLGAMFADESKVWRILMNLLTNSCKFTKNGTITLEAQRVAKDDGDRLLFRISDTGMGMAPEQTAKLFDRFAQVHASSGKMQAGVGLGLSICLLYCRAMGGLIKVESEVGRGTVFEVDLPAEVSEKPALPANPVARTTRPSPEPPPAENPPDDDRANLVLIIDDDVSVCELMRRNLGEEGIPSLAAHSGEEGLRLAKKWLPSAIILDIMMPGIDGWAVLAALKSDSEMTGIPVIMASMLDEKERGIRMGADEYVSKPLGPDRLTELIRKYRRGHDSGKILYVQDQSEMSRNLAGSLREQGWEVGELTDGPSALNSLRESRPDLILLDLMMPDRGGMSILAEIRGNDVWQSIPIIVITAADLDFDARRRLQGQVEKILTTGVFGRDDLLREVRSLIAQPRREHAAHDGFQVVVDPSPSLSRSDFSRANRSEELGLGPTEVGPTL
jgi:PAS domain S-box-containing protein